MQQNPQGIFIVLEGSDGSGKKTQFDLLKNRLIAAGYEVEVFDFPRYDKPSSHFVTRYLNGDYGPASAISPYTASLFFALDRYEAGLDIKEALSAGKIVLSNRYVGSNMAHQGSKFDDEVEKRSFFVWEDSLEFQLLNIPRPNMNIFLRVSPEISFELIKQKQSRSYTNRTHDEHEGDVEHLAKAVKTYDLLCELFPKDFKVIECVDKGKLLDIESINSKIWALIAQYLPNIEQPGTAEHPKDLLDSSETEQPVANTSGYKNSTSIKWHLNRLSLASVNELASLGLKVSVKWDKNWDNQKHSYPFFTPSDMSEKTARTYEKSYLRAIQLFQEISVKLETYLKSSVYKDSSDLHRSLMSRCIPMGAVFSVDIILEYAQAQKVIYKLRSTTNIELKALEESFVKLTKKSWLDLDSDVSNSTTDSSPFQISQIIERLGLGKLSQGLSPEQGIRITDVYPRNEIDLLVDSLYSFSDLSRDEILLALDSWDYQQKVDALNNSLKLQDTILDIPVYKFDGSTDQMSLMECLNLLDSAKFQLQYPTVRYGYEVPEIIDQAGLDDIYLELFDDFLELFNTIQKDTNESNLKYCSLSGHKIRWQATLSAADIKLMKETPSLTQITNDFIAAIVGVVSEIHPNIAAILYEKKPAIEMPQTLPKGRSRTKRRR